MYKILAALCILTIICMPIKAFAAIEASSRDLINKASEYDGKDISFTGEVIGDIMVRGDYTWINVSDGSNAIGIWVKTLDTQNINMAGRYNSHGDTVRITGVFHRACSEHGGDFDIHAGTAEVVEKGHFVKHAYSVIMIVLACVLFVAALTCMAFVLKKKGI